MLRSLAPVFATGFLIAAFYDWALSRLAGSGGASVVLEDTIDGI